MEIRQYLRVVRRRFWIPLALVLTTVLGTGTLTILSKPVYTATATVIAKSRSAGSATSPLSFQQVATSNTLGIRVQRQLGLRYSIDGLIGKIKVATGSGSDLYMVSISDEDPAWAAQLASAVSKQACQLYQELAVGSQGSIVSDLTGDQTAVRDNYLAAATRLLAFRRQHPDGENTGDVNVAGQYLQLQADERAASQAYTEFEQDMTRARVDEVNKARSNAQDFEARVVDEAAARPDTTGRFTTVEYAATLALVLGIAIVASVEYLDSSVRDTEGAEELIGAPVVGVIPSGRPASLRPVRPGA